MERGAGIILLGTDCQNLAFTGLLLQDVKVVTPVCKRRYTWM